MSSLTTLDATMDMRCVVDAFIALPDGGDIALGIDFGGDDDQSYIIFGFGDEMYRVTPDLAIRLANYIDHVCRTETIDQAESLQRWQLAITGLARGLGCTVPINH